jgi:Zn-dependent M32 family carboxypeptidase
MMKKILTIALVSVCAITFFGCKKKGEYADLKEYLSDVIKINEEYVTALEKANNAKDVAEALTDMGNKMEKITKNGEEIKKKYSDMSKIRKDPPAEIKEELDKLEQVAQRLLTVSMKTMKYMMDPEVMKASQEMAKKMGGSNVFK